MWRCFWSFCDVSFGCSAVSVRNAARFLGLFYSCLLAIAVKAPSCACGVIGLGSEVTAKFILFAEFLALRVSM